MPAIFHIVAEPDWRAACAQGSYRPPSLEQEGFVHFSYRDQVARTANARFGDRVDLLVVEFDPAQLAHPVVDEDLYGSDEDFPHVYGPIATTAAVAEHRLSRTPSGEFSFPLD
ncbi:MAG TPA: DUF952 domain-containing protein [Jatrophihabitans sp.]|jgi:uncharacterized protein (DUF952 family)|uniref:DUF952 domain-containing protein n=1 Tax=Jatrophihabitans sp. TaxID=1932789 RepID=UPI002F1050AB